MEDIVAVAVYLDDGKTRYFLTWGRIQDAVETHPLEALILKNCTRFSLGGNAIRARVCSSLQEASKEPLFYECFFMKTQVKIPFGVKTYPAWRSKMAKRMKEGKELDFLGRRELYSGTVD